MRCVSAAARPRSSSGIGRGRVAGLQQGGRVHGRHGRREPGVRVHRGGLLAEPQRLRGPPAQPGQPALMRHEPGGVPGVAAAGVDPERLVQQVRRGLPVTGGHLRERRLEHAPLQQQQVAGPPDPRFHLVQHRGQLGRPRPGRRGWSCARPGRPAGPSRRRTRWPPPGRAGCAGWRRRSGADCSPGSPASRAGAPRRCGRRAARPAADRAGRGRRPGRRAGRSRATPHRPARAGRPSRAGGRRSPGRCAAATVKSDSASSNRKPASRTWPRASRPRPSNSSSPARCAAMIAHL